MGSATFTRLFPMAMWAVPALVLLLAYGAIAVHTGNPWPWFEIVHESGDRSLVDTVFYYQHAARELPLDLVLGIAIGGCALWALPGRVTTGPHRQVLLVVINLCVILIIIVGTLRSGGPVMLWDNLIQMYTRPGQALQFGSHWRYHFLSRLTLVLGSFGVAGLIVAGLRGRQGAGFKSGQRIFIWALGMFLVMSLVFVPGTDSFIDPTFLGHQVREVFTHTLVSVPLGWWLCLKLNRDALSTSGNGTVSITWSLAVGILGVLVGIYLLTGAVLTAAVSEGQTDDMILLIFPHFFEHSFSYLVVPFTAALVYETFGRIPAGPNSLDQT